MRQGRQNREAAPTTNNATWKFSRGPFSHPQLTGNRFATGITVSNATRHARFHNTN